MYKNFIVLFITSFTLLHGMNKSSHASYDCETLTKEFDYLKNNQGMLGKLMQQKSSIPALHLNKQIAALICFGADINWKKGNDNLLDHAIDSNDVTLVKFLLERNAPANRYALQFQVRSLAIAQSLGSRINNLEATDSFRNTFAHHIAENVNFEADLLEYYLEKSNLANTSNCGGALPLHTLAEFCHAYDTPSLLKKAAILLKKTDNINKLNSDGQTPTDIAINKRVKKHYYSTTSYQPTSCKKLAQTLKQHGGKATTTNNF